MKLKWSGVAVLAVFASAAHAQSSVTLYGAIDSGVFYQSTSASSFAPTAHNNGHVYGLKDGSIYGSFWGMKGTEDIGGGYKVNFRLQGVFNSSNGKLGLADTTGTTAMFNQQTTVGLSGPFGTFDAGRQYTPMIYAMADTDVRAAQYFGSILGAWLGLNQAAGWPGTNTNVPIGALYDSNALVYQSPKFYGASVALEYAPGGVAGQIQGGTRESAVLRYSNYGLNLSAVYYNAHDTNLAAAAPTGLRQQPPLLFRREVHVPRRIGVGVVRDRQESVEHEPRGLRNDFGRSRLSVHPVLQDHVRLLLPEGPQQLGEPFE